MGLQFLFGQQFSLINGKKGSKQVLKKEKYVSLICPSCQQPYLHIDTLINPIRTIYVHRVTGKVGESGTKKPVDWCMSPNRKGSGNHKSPELLAAIKAADKINLENIKKNVASQSSVVVNFNKAQHDYEMSHSSQNIIKDAAKRNLGDKKMPFVGFDLAKAREQFPKSSVGRVGKPSVAVSYQGRLVFSSEVSKAFEGCKVAMPSQDKDNLLRMRFDGHVEIPKGKEKSLICDLLRSKPSKKTGKVMSKAVAINGELLLKLFGYDYAKAGNHTFEVEKFDIEKHAVIFSLPSTLPTPKPKKVRKVRADKKVTAGAAAGSGGATVQAINGKDAGKATPPPPAVDGDELQIEE